MNSSTVSNYYSIPKENFPAGRKPTKETDGRLNRRFGLLTGSFLLLLAGYQYFRHPAVSPWLIVLGSTLSGLALLLPGWLTPLRISWEKFGLLSGRVNTYILLTMVYFLLCIPLGWLLRLLDKDPLDKKILPGAKTYWEPTKLSGSMKFQF